MTLTFKIDIPNKLSQKDRSNFLKLLILQGQVSDPNAVKVNSCPLICIVYVDNIPIAIGAIKQVYKTPFVKANVANYKNDFNHELGYLFVINSVAKNVRGLGIATTICRLLIKHLEVSNIFATTEDSSKNPMLHILYKIGFKKLGDTYKGGQTKKNISLLVKGHKYDTTN